MKYVNEEMKPQEEWFERARHIETIDELSVFAKELLEETHHDYSTVVHAIGALALAAGWLGSSTQGITGFQANFVMWDFVRQWQYRYNKTGLRIVDFDKMLYPQYEHMFEKSISKEQFEVIQKVARENLTEKENVHPDVMKHWQRIAEGVVPFGFKIVD